MKENDNGASNVGKDDILEHISKTGYEIKEKISGAPVTPATTEEAYFALLAQDMITLATKYNKPVHDLHKQYYQVSCNREKLVRLLEGKETTKWTELEDLALKDPESEAFRFISKEKGQSEVEERMKFLELTGS